MGGAAHLPARGEPVADLADEVTARIWPCVELQWEWLGGLPPLRNAAVVGAGSMGTAAAVAPRARGTGRAARLPLDGAGGEIARTARSRYLPGVPLRRGDRGDRRAAHGARRSGPRGVGRAVQAPAGRGRRGGRARGRAQRRAGARPRVSSRRSAPHPPRTWPSESRARAVASLAGPPTRARRSSSAPRWCSPTRSADLRRQLGEVLEAGGLGVESTDDVVGAELAVCAKNAAAFASAAAAPRGATRPVRRRAAIFCEVISWRSRTAAAARRSPGWPAPATWWPRPSPRAAATAARASCGRRGAGGRRRGRWARPPSRSHRAAARPGLRARGHRSAGATGLRRVLDGDDPPTSGSRASARRRDAP